MHRLEARRLAQGCQLLWPNNERMTIAFSPRKSTVSKTKRFTLQEFVIRLRNRWLKAEFRSRRSTEKTLVRIPLANETWQIDNTSRILATHTKKVLASCRFFSLPADKDAVSELLVCFGADWVSVFERCRSGRAFKSILATSTDWRTGSFKVQVATSFALVSFTSK